MRIKKIWVMAVMFLVLVSVPAITNGGEKFPLITAKDGILQMDGKPCFLVGVFGPHAYPPTWWSYYGQPERERLKDDPVYKAIWDDPLYREVSRENFKSIGIFSYHPGITEAHLKDIYPLPPITWYGKDMTEVMQKNYLEGEAYLSKQLNGMPIIPASGWNLGVAGESKDAEEYIKKHGLPPTVLQRYPNGNPVGGYWPICFEDPLGQKLHKEFWQRGARHYLENGANIYAYEMLNEQQTGYDCACEHNRQLFKERLINRYKNILTLNQTWGTDYKSFEEVMKRMPELGTGLTRIKGLSVEWQKFLEDRCIEVIRQGGEWIREIEKEKNAPPALIGFMANTSTEFLGFGGCDFYKMAKTLDVVETEEGVPFGTRYNLDNPTVYETVIQSKSAFSYLMELDLVDAVSRNKPIINTEHYIIRFKGEDRQPTTKADIITSLWEEFLRGVSATHTYNWAVAYLTREEALAYGRKNQILLSPYLYPRESLNGFKEFQEEIEKVKDIVMSRPRLGRDADMAILFSRPTARYLIGVPPYYPEAWEKKNLYHRSVLNLYNYLLDNHYSFGFLYEEQLAERSLRRYKVIFVPQADYIYPETLKYLKDYVMNGGILVCFGNAFRYNEYGKQMDNSSLLGFEQKDGVALVETVNLGDFGKIKISTTKQYVLKGGTETLVNFPEASLPFITLSNMGTGRVYGVNTDAFRLGGGLIYPVMDYVVNKIKISAPLEVLEMEGKKAKYIEAHLIDRGEKKLLFMVNWSPYVDKVVKIKFKKLEDNVTCRLIDVVKNKICTVSGKELKGGINILLPEEERVVFLLTTLEYGESAAPMELMGDEEAKKLAAQLKVSSVSSLEKPGASKDLVFLVKDNITSGEMKDCIISAAGEFIKDVKLSERLDIDPTGTGMRNQKYGIAPRPGWIIIKYGITYKPSASESDIDKWQDKIVDALSDKFHIELIGGIKKRVKSSKEVAEFWASQVYKEVKESDCLAIDISKYANMGFKDEEANDHQGGLFDEGRSIDFPVGRQKFSGVPFNIINPPENQGKSCIILKGGYKPFFPEKAVGLEINHEVKNIYLMHAAACCNTDKAVYKLKLNHADGTSSEVEVRGGREIKDWFNEDAPDKFNLANAKIGWQGKATEKKEEKMMEIEVGIYCAKLVNPKPGQEVKTMDIIWGGEQPVPAIFGITVEKQ